MTAYFLVQRSVRRRRVGPGGRAAAVHPAGVRTAHGPATVVYADAAAKERVVMAQSRTGDKQSRRLHPRLRVVRNGDAEVNAIRAEVSATVVSLREAKPGRKARTPLDLAQAQADILRMSPEATAAMGGRLTKTPKLKDRPAAKNEFVNVFIEFMHERGTGNGKAAAKARERIMRRCRSALNQAGAGRVRGAVLPMRNFVSATVPVSLLGELEGEKSIAFVHPAEPLKLEVPRAEETSRRPGGRSVGASAKHNFGKKVLIGIIDVGGFDFAHADFLDDKKRTRFVSIWDQGGDRRPAPRGFGYGAEFTGEQLNAAIAASRKTGGLPATLLERQSQQVPGSHGTHVASIAAGNHGVCPQAKIAAVLVDIPQPGDERERRRATFADSSRITHAVEYLVQTAQRLDLPLSINISLGTNGGAHDGSSGVSRWIDALLATPERSVCVAAGNAGQEAATSEDDLGWVMGRIHTSGEVKSRGLSVDLEWTVVGNGIADVSENELELWYSAQDRLSVQVQAPGSSEWITVGPCEYVENRRLSNGTRVSIYNELYHPTNGCNYIAIYLSPNLTPGQWRGIEAGVWRVRLTGDEIRNGAFHGWIERDDPLEIGSDGRQRFFRFPSFFSTNSNVDSHSISSLACGHRVIAVANIDGAGGRINVTSSQGPTRDARCKPDIAAPGTEIVAANGFSLDGKQWVSMSGTSMASPYVAGVVGLMLSANRDLTASQCMGILQRTARPLPGNSYTWRNDAGFGRIDAEAAVREAQGFNERYDVTETRARR